MHGSDDTAMHGRHEMDEILEVDTTSLLAAGLEEKLIMLYVNKRATIPHAYDRIHRHTPV